MTGLIPPLLLLVFGAWCGTFAGSASAAGSTAGAAVLLLAVLGSPWKDPLRLGRFGRLLLPALWIVAALSAWRSPVPRASWMALLLLPAFLLLPAAVARWWSREADRRLGTRAVTVLVIGVSLWALIDYAVRDLPRVAMPLGQHNLLASWLVILLPLSLSTAREPGIWRWLGLAGGLLPAVTILATLSLAGNLALAVEAVVAFAWIVRQRRSRAWGLVPLVLVAGLGLYSQRARIASILAGQDLSLRGRAVYYEGALQGFRARPVFGWGPGSAAWTAAAFFDPVPGVSPVGEAVGELHCLPLHLAYEMGAAGLIVAFALAAAFLAQRIPESGQDAPRFAGLLGLCGAAVASLGSAALAVTALPVAVAVVAGAALGEAAPPARRLPVLLYVLAAALGLAPLQAARWAYEREELATAIRLDPSFPLYRMRLALLKGDADLALGAARDAPGVATLWTVAGILGGERAALERACSLDPFNPFPPFFLMALAPRAESAPRHGAHALLAEPRLAAATFWEERPELLARSILALRRWPEVDPGWKESLVAALPERGPGPGQRGNAINPTAWIGLEIDAEPSLALSLHTFRRRPFPAQWPLVEVRAAALPRLGLPAATTLAGPPFEVICRTP